MFGNVATTCKMPVKLFPDRSLHDKKKEDDG